MKNSKSSLLFLLVFIYVSIFFIGNVCTYAIDSTDYPGGITDTYTNRLNKYVGGKMLTYKKQYYAIYITQGQRKDSDYIKNLPNGYTVEIFLFNTLTTWLQSDVINSSDIGYHFTYDIIGGREMDMKTTKSFTAGHWDYFLFSNTKQYGTNPEKDINLTEGLGVGFVENFKFYSSFDLLQYSTKSFQNGKDTGMYEAMQLDPEKKYQSGYTAGYDIGYKNGTKDATQLEKADKALLTFTGSCLGAIGSFILYVGKEVQLFGINGLQVLLFLFIIAATIVILKFAL